MNKLLFLKILTMLGLMATLTIPLSMIEGTIAERQSTRNEAAEDISRSYAGSQELVGPILVLPYEQTIARKEYNTETKQHDLSFSTVRREYYVMPEQLRVRGQVKTESRYRGIYSVPTYQTALVMDGRFDLPATIELPTPNSQILWNEAFVWVSLTDNRGIQTSPQFMWNNSFGEFSPGRGQRIAFDDLKQEGIAAPIANLTAGKASHSFSLRLNLQGTQALTWLPSAKNMQVSLESAWPSPSFMGKFLPVERSVSKDGFKATWNVSHLASNVQNLMEKCADDDCSALKQSRFGTSFKQSLDVYQLTMRATKYGILFIVLTFTAFFLFETLTGLRVHAIQYGLVGLAMAMFFLLLTSLAEQIAFGIAYSVAATSCVLLLGVYVSAVLRSAKRGIGFGTGIGFLYGSLYLLLQSEDYALLLGSVLLFASLASFMLLTRHVNWNEVARLQSKPSA